jgi:hypothetical protein
VRKFSVIIIIVRIRGSSIVRGFVGFEGITQIDILSRWVVRIHNHVTVSTGIVQTNDMVCDASIERSSSSAQLVPVVGALDLLHLLVLQPMHALDVQPMELNTIDVRGGHDADLPSERDYHIKYVAVPDGTFGALPLPYIVQTSARSVLEVAAVRSRRSVARPIPRLLPAHSTNDFIDDATTQSFVQALYRQKFLEVIHAKDGSH